VASIKDQVYLYRGRAAAAGPARSPWTTPATWCWPTATSRSSPSSRPPRPGRPKTPGTCGPSTCPTSRSRMPVRLELALVPVADGRGAPDARAAAPGRGLPVGVIASLAPATYTKAGRSFSPHPALGRRALTSKAMTCAACSLYRAAEHPVDFDVTGCRSSSPDAATATASGFASGAPRSWPKGATARRRSCANYYPGADIRDLNSLPRR